MQQRRYVGSLTAEGLADYLVKHYEPQEDLQAQKMGEGTSLLVQIARGDKPEEKRDAVTLALSQSSNGEAGIVVTMGQQQWITPKLAAYSAMIGLVGLLITPWALFGLLWPLSQTLGGTLLPRDIWNTIDLYAASQGATTQETQLLEHPHLQEVAKLE